MNFMRPGVFAISVAVAIIVVAGCLTKVSDQVPDRLCVTVASLAEMVGRIAGDQVSVDVLVGPGQSPATYEPMPAQMAALGRTQILFGVGVPFENAVLPRVEDLYSNLRVVDLCQGRDLLSFANKHDDGHHHGSVDPHVWLDPQLMKKMAWAVAEEMIALKPDAEDDIRHRLADYQQDLDSLDARMAEILTGLAGRRMYVYHPSYGYFARRYGLKQVAVELDGKEPSVRRLVQFTTDAREDQVSVVFVQPQFSAQSATTLAESVGARIVELDPLAADYMDNMFRIGHAVAAALDDTEGETER